MTEQKMTKEKRSRGRPTVRTEQETRALLLTAAADVFLSEGYAGTSIEAVARRAGMSTRTIYKTVSNKASLFRLVADNALETGIAHLDTSSDATSVEGALFALSRAYADLVLSNAGVLNARAVFAEQSQFPEFRENYLSSIKTVADAFDRRFVVIFSDCTTLQERDLYEAASLLRSMINGAQREAVLDPAYDGTAAAISAWSDTCTNFALRAMRNTQAANG
ncbi:TetR/AcrR family transcriptional regulator [Sulfitobacter guttiformis]|uniref:TetR family transcriptional regulator n=1 Tax=Sulfitobacter guttiformis TaxID=74349 RepID=A0A420DI11_9RHOB|nr:TetR/AcrR family transcriptional regulator [Sulfitobacter guttiformis]KIN72390.1 Transcriptional regulator, TetR family [Sulfitobacter guttiformis KCTC 32187]RKE93854.1 TetR family transcriptional regulator [Sulfitobacter guttiformis]